MFLETELLEVHFFFKKEIMGYGGILPSTDCAYAKLVLRM